MKKIGILLNLILLTFLLSSCWGKIDVNKLSTASAIGVDISEQGYKVTIQALNASSLAQKVSNRSNIVVYSQEGKSTFEALRKLTFYFPSRIFMAQFQLLIFGEEFAKSGKVGEVLSFLYNDPETRQKYNIAVVKGGTAEDLLKIVTPLNPNPATEINSSIQSAHDSYGTSHLIYADEFLACLRSPLNNPILSGLEIIGPIEKGGDNKNLETSSAKTKVKVEELAVFKGNKLAGWLSSEESKGYTFLMGEIVSAVIPLVYGEDKHINFEVDQESSKLKFLIVDGAPIVKVNVKMRGFISTLEVGVYNLTEQDIKQIQELVSEKVKELIEMTINTSQHVLNSDFFKIGALIHRTKPKYWHKIENQYADELYQTIEFKVNVKVKVVNTPV